MHSDDRSLSRRTVALGTAGAGAALFAAGSIGTAQAATVGTPQAHAATVAPAADPGGPRIGSAPLAGYQYLYRSYAAFSTFLGGDWMWTQTGVYSTNPNGGQLMCPIDLPAGAVLRDVEWYVSASVAAQFSVRLWTTGTAQVKVIATSSLAAGGDVIRAHRTVVPAADSGPYAPGSSAHLWVETSPQVKLNGARIGYTAAPSGTVLLPTPVRVYDSRSGTKIGNGQTRIHSLATQLPAGASAAIVNVTATGGEKTGGLAVYGTAVPAGSSLYWDSATVSNEVHTVLGPDRRFKVTSRGVTGCKVHYLIDLVGYTV